MKQHLAEVLNSKQISLSVLEELAENSFDSVLITDSSVDSKIIYVNRAFERLTGFQPSEVIGKTPRILQGPGTDEAVIERLRKALKRGERFEGRAINYKKDRTPFMMEWRVVPARVGADTKVWLSIQRQAPDEA